ncbi:hypothetical protein BA065_01905 [Nanoarchaeota archaeon NZ13-N]|uniref:Uncharacterized protein n=1 Tax=Candidatus Nanoclepta minutus TaxID=1940235 RepID=A0A397WMS3_9ARCH|nr:MAG: hypothetical protein BA065_01905 [Nanoarchaeota archaeon NZ13-N]RIB35201.1 MAG: hypothetical protein BXU00_02635 [Candidatus Nanoclepta minutus]
MRGWVILLETIFSIILLTSAYLYLSNNINFQKSYNLNIESEYFRTFSEGCASNYVYLILFLENNQTLVCINGRIGSIEELKGYSLTKTYIFSGKDSYRPFILYIYT